MFEKDLSDALENSPEIQRLTQGRIYPNELISYDELGEFERMMVECVRNLSSPLPDDVYDTIEIKGIGRCRYPRMFGMDPKFDKQGNHTGYRTGYFDKKRVWVDDEPVEFEEIS